MTQQHVRTLTIVLGKRPTDPVGDSIDGLVNQHIAHINADGGTVTAITFTPIFDGLALLCTLLWEATK
jgi:hypothetical protein